MAGETEPTASHPASAGGVEGDAKTPRKPRRRRGGRRQREARERVEARLLHGDRIEQPSTPAPAPEVKDSPQGDGLLARLKRKVGRFFNRPPARH